MIINIGRPEHLPSAEMEARPTDRFLTFAEAATIAAWWQSAGEAGKSFAALASTGRVDADELRSAIVGELRSGCPYPPLTESIDLCDLYAWSVWYEVGAVLLQAAWGSPRGTWS